MENVLRVLMIALLSAGPLAAQSTAVRTAEPPRIDGSLEEVWKTGLRFSAFKKIEPSLEGDPSVRTEAYFLYDEHNVYMAARLYQPADSIHGGEGRRDSTAVWDGDYVLFAIDPQASGDSAYYFAVNAAGAIGDGILDSHGQEKPEWDGVFAQAVSVLADGWSVEIRLPLTSISFQSKEIQEWGFLAMRRHAQKRERLVSHLNDPNSPYRIDTFHRIEGLEGLARAARIQASPYVYAARAYEGDPGASDSDAKTGLDLKYTPNAALSVLATVNPDYAQLESDREIINVTDVPSSYPEKRPFFTESNDLYPGLAVNTRNIEQIQAGVKLRHVLPRLRYDISSVYDGEDALWLLGDLRFSDNKSYHAELIAGMRDDGADRDYNVTGHARTWFFDRRLTAYTWYGTVNSAAGAGNEFESVNSVKWITRTLNAGVWTHFKSKLYDPGVLGHHTLSNQIIVSSWIGGSLFRENGRVRRLSPELKLDYTTLYEDAGEIVPWSAQLTATIETELRLSEKLGNWTFVLTAQPGTHQLFRYRNTAASELERPFEDAYGRFALVRSSRPGVTIELQSDSTRSFGASARYSIAPVRGSSAHDLRADLYWRPANSTALSYGLDAIDVAGSDFQLPYRETIHRLKIERTIRGTLNIRAVVRHHAREQRKSGSETEISTNLTAAWRIRPDTTLYVLYNEGRLDHEDVAPDAPEASTRGRSFAIKFARGFTF